MRKKLLLVALVIAVLAVWGLVGFRVWNLARPEVTQSVKTEKKTETHFVTKDSLRLDYRDPFLESGNAKAIVPEKKVAAIPEHPVQMPPLKYKGMVKGKDGTVKAIVENRGEVVFFAKGAMLERVRVVEIEPEHILVQFGNETHLIRVR